MPRRQLSLFVTGPRVAEIERVRQKMDPVQHALIPAHVTLARDDEAEPLDIDLMQTRAAAVDPIRLTFDGAESVAGHGVLLRTAAGHLGFQALRRRLLESKCMRELRPHLTLAHARNPRADGNRGTAVDLALPLTVTFDRVMLIEQRDPLGKWEVMGTFFFRSSRAEANR